jgi:hypothetical protein
MNVRGTTQRLQSSLNAQITANQRMSEKRFPNKCRCALINLVDSEKRSWAIFDYVLRDY